MIKRLMFILVTMTILAACGNAPALEGSENSQTAEESLQPLEVEILTDSEAFKPNEEGLIEIKVTKGNENVVDADEVQFEIWKEGYENESEKFDANNEGDGIYTLSHTFEEGIYYAIAHVTARGGHTMPKKEFIVGEVEDLSSSE